MEVKFQYSVFFDLLGNLKFDEANLYLKSSHMFLKLLIVAEKVYKVSVLNFWFFRKLYSQMVYRHKSKDRNVDVFYFTCCCLLLLYYFYYYYYCYYYYLVTFFSAGFFVYQELWLAAIICFTRAFRCDWMRLIF